MAKRIVIVEDDPDQRSNYVDAITKKRLRGHGRTATGEKP